MVIIYHLSLPNAQIIYNYICVCVRVQIYSGSFVGILSWPIYCHVLYCPMFIVYLYQLLYYNNACNMVATMYSYVKRVLCVKRTRGKNLMNVNVDFH